MTSIAAMAARHRLTNGNEVRRVSGADWLLAVGSSASSADEAAESRPESTESILMNDFQIQKANTELAEIL